ncbi:MULTISPECIES: hypothetical protein [Micromonospora]|uniref:hypothetical protein n=1 Tax=Micromonospora TaxID=1873 RepID=UPI001E60B76B
MTDGATDLYHDAVLPAESDVQWLVDTVDELLAQAGAGHYRGPAAALLSTIADEVARRQITLGFPDERVPPACSIVLCVDQGTHYNIGRIGDATAVVTGAESAVLATGYFDRREATAVAAGGVDRAEVTRAMHQRRLHTMAAGDVESVFSGHPRRALRPYSVVGRWGVDTAILLCTDGFARLVTDYHICADWPKVVEVSLRQGLAYLEKLIRDAEAAPGGRAGRFKRADDVAAVLLRHG